MTSTRRSEPTRKEPPLSTEEQLVLAIESLSEHLVLFDAEDRIVLANRAWKELNKDVVEFTKPGTHFEDHLRALIEKGLVPEASGREEEWLHERMERHLNPSGPFEVARQDGRWIRIHEQRLPNNGIILIISDITESKQVDRTLRESEERFSKAFQSNPSLMAIAGVKDGKIYDVNDSWCSTMGFTRDEAIGKTGFDLGLWVDPSLRTSLVAALKKEGSVRDLEIPFRTIGGRIRDFLVAVELIELDGGPRLLFVSHDITERKQAENALRAAHDTLEQRVRERTVALEREIAERKHAEETLLASEHALQERVADLEEAHRKLEMQGESLVRLADDLLVARDEARAADRSKSEFLASMSHELRTPLNAVLGFSELIKDETFGPVGSVQYRDYAEDIHDSGQHLLGLINDILDLSKIESGTDELHEDEIEIPEISRSALMLVGHRAEQGGIKLELELRDPLPALRADERKLKQILVNLLSNAIKFTGAGGEVTLRAWCRMDSGYVFQIIDTGIGIAPEDIPKALSRFGQVDADLNRQYEGTGLGLPLTKALVELHGGALDLQSKIGVGTTVTVRFPAERIMASLDNADSLDVEHRAAS